MLFQLTASRLGKRGKSSMFGSTGWPGEVPQEGVDISSLGVGTLQQGVDLLHHKRGEVMMPEREEKMAVDYRCLHPRHSGRVCVDLDLEREFLIPMRRHTGLVKRV